MSETKIVVVHLPFIDSSTVVDVASMTIANQASPAARPSQARPACDRHRFDGR